MKRTHYRTKHRILVSVLALFLFTIAAYIPSTFRRVGATDIVVNSPTPGPSQTPVTIPSPTPTKEPETVCVNPAKLKNICGAIVTLEEDPVFPNNPYIFEKKILEASCAVPGDSEDIIKNKVKNAWPLLEDKLTCNVGKFDVINGSLIKLAVINLVDRFILDVKKWEVNLNRIDKSDNKTVLDYIQDQIELKKGTAIEPIMRNYYRDLRTSGAKHRSEL